MATEKGTSGASGIVRTSFGVLLLALWIVGAILWVYSAFYSLSEGEARPLISAVCAILLMLLLAGMEGLEVAVIDRWRELYPDRPNSELAGWLAARQLFVALIVTGATMLAEPERIVVPFASVTYDGGLVLKLFTVLFIGVTVLWFMQIFPKHLAATNPDRYLRHTRPGLFPIVEVVRLIGFAQPGEWAAKVVERVLDWHAPEPGIEEAPARRGETLADAWAALIPPPAPARTRTPDDRAGATGS